MIGKTISHYKIIEKIGEGGMGVVYKARDTKLDRVVALKFLPSHLTKKESDLKRFIQEAKAAAALNHPNVCTIHEIHDEGENPFIVMEYVEGETLRERKKEKGKKIQQIIDYAIQIAEALKTAHAKGVVHRDIKSDNIMITDDGRVKVMDFGLAKLRGSVQLTKSSSTLGTVAYMSPEHLQGQEVDARTDIFSFGVVLYEMLTGKLPFKGEYDSAMMYAIVNEEPQQIQQYRSDLPSELLHVLNRALEKDPEERYQSVKEMLIDLKRLKRDTSKVSRDIFMGGEEAVSKEGGFKRHFKKSRRPLWIALGVLIVLIPLILLFLSPLLKQKHTPFQTKENSIAVMYFENRSGEPDLEKILVDMLTTNLARYEEIEVVSSQRLHDILKIIGKQDIEVITKDIATQVARHAGVETMMLGSIIKIGDRIRIPVQLCDVQSGTVTGSEQVEGEQVEDLFDMADRLTVKVGSMLGNSAGEKHPLKVAEVTTSSLEAYKYFLKGQEAYEKMYYNEAKQFLEKAVTLDSTFASAYTYLAFTQDGKAKIRSLQKAMMYSEKISERERLMIEAAYALLVEDNLEMMLNKIKEVVEKYPDYKYGHYYLGRSYDGKKQYDKAIEAYKKVVELDPAFGPALNEVAYVYSEIGEYGHSIEYLQKYAAVSSGDANPFDSMGDMYYWMGKINDAIAMYQEALKVRSDFASGIKIPYMYALQENYTESIQWINNYIQTRGSVHDKATGYLLKGYYLYWVGDFNESLNNLHLYQELARTSGNSESAVADLVKGLIYYEKGDFDLSRQYFNTFYNQSPHQPIVTYIYNFCSGLLYLKQGKIDSARTSLSEIQTLLSEQSGIDRSMIQYCYDYLLAEVLLKENAVEKSIEISRKASTKGKAPLPDVIHWHIRYNLPFIRDVGARAYIQKKDIDKAITEYEKLITFDPESEDRRLIHPRMHYRLAKLYEEKGWQKKAIEEYETFLDIWKHADEDLPEVVDARARLSGLKD